MPMPTLRSAKVPFFACTSRLPLSDKTTRNGAGGEMRTVPDTDAVEFEGDSLEDESARERVAFVRGIRVVLS